MASRALRIVVVDDNVDNTDMLALLLQMSGYEVIRSYEGGDAIEKTCAYQADVVLIDLAMPEINGYEVARQIRQRAVCKGALLVAVTGYSDDEHRRLAMQAGFDHYFVKPVNYDVLCELLEARKSKGQNDVLPAR